MKYLLLILFVLIIPNVCANCEEGQIDINTASLEKLEELNGIGPVKAQAIINTRPFESVDDLIEVYGIGDVTLQKIKEQGLACVEYEESKKEFEEEDIEENKNQDNPEEATENFKTISEKQEINLKKPEPEVIKLNPQIIKSKNNNENSDNEKISGNNYAVYGFMVFCLLLGFLFIIKKNRFNKNEFR